MDGPVATTSKSSKNPGCLIQQWTKATTQGCPALERITTAMVKNSQIPWSHVRLQPQLEGSYPEDQTQRTNTTPHTIPPNRKEQQTEHQEQT